MDAPCKGRLTCPYRALFCLLSATNSRGVAIGLNLPARQGVRNTHICIDPNPLKDIFFRLVLKNVVSLIMKTAKFIICLEQLEIVELMG